MPQAWEGYPVRRVRSGQQGPERSCTRAGSAILAGMALGGEPIGGLPPAAFGDDSERRPGFRLCDALARRRVRRSAEIPGHDPDGVDR